ncbi:AAA-ATPase At2g18193-like isoform X1 [Lotus japonicus]|uniref:AAA-ATPase At2g18193-like isoform X1 n=1 Tax=Lotus japonicus TaxID=34305 RepID=UPI00258ED36E|nr:AAA-ATPase At2g18193-like isoform X1 [Lotus japonicus]
MVPLVKKDKACLRIEQFWDVPNEFYVAANSYLPTLVTSCLRVARFDNKVMQAVEEGQHAMDQFEGINIGWKLEVDKAFTNGVNRAIILSFNKNCMEKVIHQYLPHIVTLHEYECKVSEVKFPKIFSHEGYWNGYELSHPAMDTLSINPSLKEAIIEDLERFLSKKEFYKRVGKPWKRGYLLYGPPGTGKSSLIAAMANYLKFDIYHLKLSNVMSDAHLKKMLLRTPKHSMIVIEDIDCNKGVHAGKMGEEAENDKHKFNLSTILNFMDGLCSGEKIIVFTTNHKEKELDPALLSPGRMDFHINLSYLKSKPFQILAKNYLGIEHHPTFEEIQCLLEVLEVTPAEVAELLLQFQFEDAESSLECLLNFLKKQQRRSEGTSL